MQTFKRICIKDFKVTDDEGNHFELIIGKEYLTSAIDKKGKCVVFSNYWVKVPADCFKMDNDKIWPDIHKTLILTKDELNALDCLINKTLGEGSLDGKPFELLKDISDKIKEL